VRVLAIRLLHAAPPGVPGDVDVGIKAVQHPAAQKSNINEIDSADAHQRCLPRMDMAKATEAVRRTRLLLFDRRSSALFFALISEAICSNTVTRGHQRKPTQKGLVSGSDAVGSAPPDMSAVQH